MIRAPALRRYDVLFQADAGWPMRRDRALNNEGSAGHGLKGHMSARVMMLSPSNAHRSTRGLTSPRIIICMPRVASRRLLA